MQESVIAIVLTITCIGFALVQGYFYNASERSDVELLENFDVHEGRLNRLVSMIVSDHDTVLQEEWTLHDAKGADYLRPKRIQRYESLLAHVGLHGDFAVTRTPLRIFFPVVQHSFFLNTSKGYAYSEAPPAPEFLLTNLDHSMAISRKVPALTRFRSIDNDNWYLYVRLENQ